jgi:hypothetical protein
MVVIDIKAILNKRMENCETCPVDDQPDPDAECDQCMEKALAEGRSAGLSPETEQVLTARSLAKVGYPFAANDLAYWQWLALAAVDREIDKYQAEKLKNSE